MRTCVVFSLSTYIHVIIIYLQREGVLEYRKCCGAFLLKMYCNIVLVCEDDVFM